MSKKTFMQSSRVVGGPKMKSLVQSRALEKRLQIF